MRAETLLGAGLGALMHRFASTRSPQRSGALALLTLQILLLLVCMLTMALKVMSRNYRPATLAFIASTAILVLLAYPRYGLSATVVAYAAGTVVAFLLIGLANYWVRSRVVGWSMPFWSKFITFQPPINADYMRIPHDHLSDSR